MIWLGELTSSGLGSPGIQTSSYIHEDVAILYSLYLVEIQVDRTLINVQTATVQNI